MSWDLFTLRYLYELRDFHTTSFSVLINSEISVFSSSLYAHNISTIFSIIARYRQVFIISFAFLWIFSYSGIHQSDHHLIMIGAFWSVRFVKPLHFSWSEYFSYIWKIIHRKSYICQNPTPNNYVYSQLQYILMTVKPHHWFVIWMHSIPIKKVHTKTYFCFIKHTQGHHHPYFWIGFPRLFINI